MFDISPVAITLEDSMFSIVAKPHKCDAGKLLSYLQGMWKDATILQHGLLLSKSYFDRSALSIPAIYMAKITRQVGSRDVAILGFVDGTCVIAQSTTKDDKPYFEVVPKAFRLKKTLHVTGYPDTHLKFKKTGKTNRSLILSADKSFANWVSLEAGIYLGEAHLTYEFRNGVEAALIEQANALIAAHKADPRPIAVEGLSRTALPSQELLQQAGLSLGGEIPCRAPDWVEWRSHNPGFREVLDLLGPWLGSHYGRRIVFKVIPAYRDDNDKIHPAYVAPLATIKDPKHDEENLRIATLIHTILNQVPPVPLSFMETTGTFYHKDVDHPFLVNYQLNFQPSAHQLVEMEKVFGNYRHLL